MNASTNPLPSLSYGVKSTAALAALAASSASCGERNAVPFRPIPDPLFAYHASVCGIRYGPTTVPASVTRPFVTSE